MSERGDLEIVRACALAMGFDHIVTPKHVMTRPEGSSLSYDRYYNPLCNDAEAMALVKRLKLDIEASFEGMSHWNVAHENGGSSDQDLNRAICLCVANLSRAG